METTYYTCLNNRCPKHRAVFAEGDPQHAECERARLYLEGQTPIPVWVWFALAAAVVLPAAAAVAALRMRAANPSAEASFRERRTQTWSGREAILDERRGHSAPPPIR